MKDKDNDIFKVRPGNYVGPGSAMISMKEIRNRLAAVFHALTKAKHKVTLGLLSIKEHPINHAFMCANQILVLDNRGTWHLLPAKMTGTRILQDTLGMTRYSKIRYWTPLPSWFAQENPILRQTHTHFRGCDIYCHGLDSPEYQALYGTRNTSEEQEALL